MGEWRTWVRKTSCLPVIANACLPLLRPSTVKPAARCVAVDGKGLAIMTGRHNTDQVIPGAADPHETRKGLIINNESARRLRGMDGRPRMKRSTQNVRPAAPRRRNAERTKAKILVAATREFMERGLNGARVDSIAARTRTNKRMIYYYFTSKERLYVAVLEDAYRKIREAERQLKLDDLPPGEAIRRLVEFTFDYHWKNPQLAKLVVVENIHKGKYLAHSGSIFRFNLSIIDTIAKVLRRGVEEGVLRADIDPVELHMTISALSLFHVTNRYTFGTVFSRDMVSPEAAAQRKKELVDIISRYVSVRCPAAGVLRQEASPHGITQR